MIYFVVVFNVFSIQGKFSIIPSVFVTAAHHHAGLKRDAASVWIEDVTQSSFKVCLRELQNYAGSHEDVHVVSAPASVIQVVYIFEKHVLCFVVFALLFLR